MIKNKRIGVVVLNYRDSDTTKRLCNSIIAYSTIDNIVVIDNKSPDNSFSDLKILEKEKVKVLQSDKNGGYSYGNNYGINYLIENYGSDIIFIANPDVKFSEQFVKKTANILIDKGFQAVSGVMVTPKKTISVQNTVINSYIDDLLDCTLILKKVFKRKKYNVKMNSGLLETQFLYGSLFAISSDAFLEIDGFDSRVFLYCEERILGKKFLNHKLKMCIDTSTFFIHEHAVSINKTITKINQVEQLYTSRLFYYEHYCEISKTKLKLLKVAMNYGLMIRKKIS